MSFNNQSEIISTLTNIQSILNHFPFVLLILGTIGFLGNCLTFLHPTIRRNTCSIYSLCNTISDELELLVNLLPDYLALLGYTISYDTISSSMCKFLMLLRTFFPQLSISFLILTLIDRYACSCSLTSKWRKINQLKLVPWMILLAILYSLSIAMQALIFYDITPLPISLCITTYSLLTSIFYVITSTVIQVLLLSFFVLFLFRNIKRSRQRVNIRVPNRMNHQFIRVTVVQALVTNLLSIQWIICYSFSIISAQNIFSMSLEQITIIVFILRFSYQIFYINFVKFFYVSTLASSLYRKTFKMAIKQLLAQTKDAVAIILTAICNIQRRPI